MTAILRDSAFGAGCVLSAGEIAIRMALRARGGDVRCMIPEVAVSVILARVLKSQEFQVTETDFVALSVAVAVLIA